MKVAVHLVSLPWALVFQPSVALGCLKAYVDKYFDGKVACYSYSAFAEVLIDALGDNFIKYADPGYPWRSGEGISQIVYFEEFKRDVLNKKHRNAFIRQIRKTENSFSLSVAGRLRSSLKAYLDDRIAPNLRQDSVNVVGMTMTMQQSYSSAFAGKYLKENYPDFNYVFLYGGPSADSVNVANVFADEEIPGFFVIGEGEAKLVSIIETVQKIDSWSEKSEEQIAQNTPGVLPVSRRILLYERNNDFYKTQLEMGCLPEPDYREYFDTLKRICEDSDTYDEFMEMVRIPLEGTRGCFGKCDFCSLNRVWKGFRSRLPGQIASTALNKTYEYNCNKIMFVDSSCDKWAEEYADEIIESTRSMAASMELRTGHPESFWTKLVLSGVKNVQIGTEALSSPLLKAIGKGTTVVQNVLAQKYLSELEVTPHSNIMAYHPRSTVEDVKYTKYVLDHLPHFEQYSMTYFALVQGSPLYLQLSLEGRRKLKIWYRTPGQGKYKDLYISELFTQPENWLSPQIRRAWTDFVNWHETRKKRFLEEPERLDVIECSADMLWIRRVSGGKQKDFKYDGRYSAVYELCHQGLSLEKICDQLNYQESGVINILKDFKNEKLIIDIEGVFISLALRSRDALIKNLYELN